MVRYNQLKSCIEPFISVLPAQVLYTEPFIWVYSAQVSELYTEPFSRICIQSPAFTLGITSSSLIFRAVHLGITSSSLYTEPFICVYQLKSYRAVHLGIQLKSRIQSRSFGYTQVLYIEPFISVLAQVLYTEPFIWVYSAQVSELYTEPFSRICIQSPAFTLGITSSSLIYRAVHLGIPSSSLVYRAVHWGITSSTLVYRAVHFGITSSSLHTCQPS